MPPEWPPPGPSRFPDSPADEPLPALLARSVTDAEMQRELARRFPRYGSPDVRPVQFAETYAHLLAVAVARAEWLGVVLQQQLEREGLSAMVGKVYALTKTGDRIAVSEEVRVIARLESEERTRAERLARDGIRIGIEASQVDAMRSYGKTVVTTMRTFAAELGLDWNDPVITRIARRAILSARQQLGFDVRPAEEAGPGLSEEERSRVLGRALEA